MLARDIYSFEYEIPIESEMFGARVNDRFPREGRDVNASAIPQLNTAKDVIHVTLRTPFIIASVWHRCRRRHNSTIDAPVCNRYVRA